MININELRQNITTYGLEATCADDLIGLLDRLESAEQTVQDYLRIDREKAQIAQRLEAAEKERDALRNEIAFVKEVEFPRKVQVVADAWKGKCERIEVDCGALRAKIAEMERQEPVAEWVDGAFDQYPHLRWREPYKAIVGAKLYTKLYALPGASLNLNDPAVQKRLAAQWGYGPAEVQPAAIDRIMAECWGKHDE